jgi:hypothetical protein
MLFWFLSGCHFSANFLYLQKAKRQSLSNNNYHHFELSLIAHWHARDTLRKLNNARCVENFFKRRHALEVNRILVRRITAQTAEETIEYQQ